MDTSIHVASCPYRIAQRDVVRSVIDYRTNYSHSNTLLGA